MMEAILALICVCGLACLPIFIIGLCASENKQLPSDAIE